MPENPSNFWQELKRRKVFGVIIIYVTISVAIIGLVSDVYEPLGLPPSAQTLVIVILAIGFPVAVIFAWIFDITSKGIKKTEPLDDVTEGKEIQSIIDKKTIPEKSIIVLPFDNMSSDPEQEYFSDGLTEEIITDLSHLQNFLVISRSSAMTFKGSNKKIKDIANEVNVKYVLEGSVRKSGNDLRITGQLIDAESDTHIWAKKYNGSLEDIFDIQEKVSSAIVQALKIKITSEEQKKLGEHSIENIQAYEVYLRAKYEIWKITEESLNQAVELFQNALDLIGDNPLLYAGMGYAYFQFVNMGIKQEDYIDRAEECIKKVFELDPDSALGNLIQGNILSVLKGNHELGLAHLKKAYVSNPNDPEVLLWLSFGNMIVGKLENAKPLIEIFMRVDPTNIISYLNNGWYYVYNGQFEEGLRQFSKAISIDPKNILIVYHHALFLAYNNKLDESVKVVDANIESTPQYAFGKLPLLLKYAIEKNTSMISELVDDEMSNTAQRDPQFSHGLSSLYALAGIKEKALDWLENAVHNGFLIYPFLNQHDPFLESIRGEDRFKKLMAITKQKWKNFKV